MKNSTLHLLAAAIAAIGALIATFAGGSFEACMALCLMSGQQIILHKMARHEEIFSDLLKRIREGLSEK